MGPQVCAMVDCQARRKMPTYRYTYDKPLTLQIRASTRAEADEKFTVFNKKLLKIIYEEKGISLDKGTQIQVDEAI